MRKCAWCKKSKPEPTIWIVDQFGKKYYYHIDCFNKSQLVGKKN